jgi:hypothetical protein
VRSREEYERRSFFSEALSSGSFHDLAALIIPGLHVEDCVPSRRNTDSYVPILSGRYGYGQTHYTNLAQL